MIKRYNEGNLSIWNYKKFYAVGICGRLDRSLEEVCGSFKGDNDLEFGEPIERTNESYALSGVHHNPAISVGIIRQRDGASSILNSSIDKQKSIEIIRKIIKQYGFVPTEPILDFILATDEEFYTAIELYKRLLDVQRNFNCCLDKAYGLVTYSTFLSKHKGLSTQEAIKRAKSKLGLV